MRSEKNYMENLKILYLSQEITPFLPESPISMRSRMLPQYMHEKGHEIRVFMPRYGCINERRHQLHEVIRLSGMNLVINDSDHPLIIKVASIPQIRMQVYFIDNDEYFKRKAVVADADGKFFADNDERALFFCKGALETVKKLGWKPDIVHCHGWMTSLAPMLIRKVFNEDPHFENSKIIYSPYSVPGNIKFDASFTKKLMFEDELEKSDVEILEDPSMDNLHRAALKFSDAVVKGSPDLEKNLVKAIDKSGLEVMEYCADEDYAPKYAEFYQMVFESATSLA
jgi:starch synthase